MWRGWAPKPGICQKLALGGDWDVWGPWRLREAALGAAAECVGGVPGCSTGTLGVGGLAGTGVFGRGFGRSGDRLLTAPTRTALGTAPFVDLELLGPAVEGSLGWGSEGQAEGDQDPQV